MTKDLLKLSTEQLVVYRELQKIKMAWVAFWFVMPLFAIGVLSFIFAVFFVNQQTLPKTIVGGVDTLLGLVVHRIVSFLFPKAK